MERTIQQIQCEAQKLNIRMPDSPWSHLWTDEEDNILIEYYPKEGTNVINRLNNRTKSQILQRASKLNLKFAKYISDDEIELIKKYYPEGGYKEVQKYLDKSKSYIQGKASALGIKLNSRGWSQEQTDVIQQEYSNLGGKGLLEKYPRLFFGKNSGTLNTYANSLGLKCGDNYVISMYTNEADNIIKKYYPEGGVKECLKYLSQFSEMQIASRAAQLKIKTNKKLRKILCIETNITYNNGNEANEAMGYRKGSDAITLACRTGKTAKGYHWKYINEEDEENE